MQSYCIFSWTKLKCLWSTQLLGCLFLTGIWNYSQLLLWSWESATKFAFDIRVPLACPAFASCWQKGSTFKHGEDFCILTEKHLVYYLFPYLEIHMFLLYPIGSKFESKSMIHCSYCCLCNHIFVQTIQALWVHIENINQLLYNNDLFIEPTVLFVLL